FLDERASRGDVRRSLTADAERALTRYLWPGNVRELHHCLERASVMSLVPALNAGNLFGSSGDFVQEGDVQRQPLSNHLQECERAYIRRALTECDGRIADTAALLGISRKNLWEKMRKLEMAEG
ncbi:MAG: sigma-54-dependent Fis family transcriptional regulator, partial [Sulfuritalea sp.]|nr:sigma-54-dependent Fis family transcriptional regulator [Sulfuritalea sp.]